ncbi:fucose pyrophosphorylase domain-containing protein [Acetivibrio cellulolyticus]|uniref:fucose pyrophosphorylase domain-containing protein n=1 Tax=Acetivibrio cellulolyticus TaxID=35830 RepID=UPI0001E2C705|nr:L-fucokinase [Acetivibrio cellulolyticus]
MNKTYNVEDINRLFIQQSYLDNWDKYVDSINCEAECWDYIVITASNERQAQAYRIQIDERQKNGVLPEKTKCIVLSDPDGKRVGSGGATLNVLKEIYKLENMDVHAVEKLRILLIHSGGDSKRVPQYSAIGKLFSPVPRELPDGRLSTLFDELLIAFSGLPTRMQSGMVLAAGDILILFNHMQADFIREGAVALSTKAYANQGTNHGVFCVDQKGRVQKFLHKYPVERLRSEGAVNAVGSVDIDTGTFWLSSEIVLSLLGLICDDSSGIDESKFLSYVNDKVALSFYADFVIPMTAQASFDGYLLEPGEGPRTVERDECRRVIWSKMKDHKLVVQRLSPAEFIHFGTTYELREIMTGASKARNHLNWNNNTGSSGKAINGTTLINSCVSKASEIGANCYIENCVIHEGAKIDPGAIVSCCELEKGAKVGPEMVWQVLPVTYEGRNGFTARVYGTKDNPKNEAGRGGVLMGYGLLDWMKDNNIQNADLWENEALSLWEAKLYPFCKTACEAISWAQALQDSVILRKAFNTERWKKMPRLSLQSSFAYADIPGILSIMQNSGDNAAVAHFIDAVTSGTYVGNIMRCLGIGEAIARRMSMILNRTLESSWPMEYKTRVYRALAEVSKVKQLQNEEMDPKKLENLCFDEINSAICSALLEDISDDGCRALVKDSAVVSLPVRVNTGGEWSDTPPYSLENGGTVLNIAVTIGGKLPIKAKAERIDKPVIRLSSIDLGITRDFDSFEKLLRYDDPSDPFALHKAALVVTGVLPRKEKLPRRSFRDMMDALGGGLLLETNVLGIPKGSGLGTSSILASAAVMAIREILGLQHDDQQVFSQVLVLEQLMTTGGGWQDQAGGIIPGIKLLSTKPGLKQKITAEKIVVSKETLHELNQRLVLIYSGQRRLAKSILRSIMGRYILNEPEALEILVEIQRLSVLMKFELEKGNIDKFSELMNIHREKIRKLDAGSSNTYIDLIMKVCEPYLSGIMFCGAAGGGFLIGVLKDADKKEVLSTSLCEVFQDTQVALWDIEIYNSEL